jgi:hypothetical protein
LGILLGAAGVSSRDKVRFVASESLAPVAAWIEQLVAESTGKEKRGMIPIESGSDLVGSAVGDDTVLISLALAGDRVPVLPSGVKAQTPVVKITLPSVTALGAEIYKWEMATAVAAAVLEVNPFDEPNVAESKQNTGALLATYHRQRQVVRREPLGSAAAFDILGVSGVGAGDGAKAADSKLLVRTFLTGIGASEYLAILAYVEMTAPLERLLLELRRLIEAEYGITTLRGFGPRFLHSIGQLYKGGPQKGHFLVLQREYTIDYPIPKLGITFGRLIMAQAEGDIQALAKRKRPLLSLNLRHDPAAGLRNLIGMIRA